MVLGLRSKSRKGASVQVDYIIHLQEIKPWPPSQSLKSLRSVVLQWENGDRNSGSTSPSIPSLLDGKIEFSESFKLQVTLSKEASAKGNDNMIFQKNLLKLSLYEIRRDKTVKGQHLGSAAIGLAEHGVIKETVSVSVPLNCKRSFRNTAQPLLFVKIQPVDKDGTSTSIGGSLSKEVSLDNDSKESVSALMNEEYAEESEIASFTDDDDASHSSLTNTTFANESNADWSPQTDLEAKDVVAIKEGCGMIYAEAVLPFESVPAKSEVKLVTTANGDISSATGSNGSSSQSSSMDSSYDLGGSEDADVSVSSSPQRNLLTVPGDSETCGIHSSLSSLTCEDIKENGRPESPKKCMEDVVEDGLDPDIHKKAADCRVETNEDFPIQEVDKCNKILERTEAFDKNLHVEEKQNLTSIQDPEANSDEDVFSERNRNRLVEVSSTNAMHHMFMKGKTEERQLENTDNEVEETQSKQMIISFLSNNPRDDLSLMSVSRAERIAANQQHSTSQSAFIHPVISSMLSFSQNVNGGKGTGTLTNGRLTSKKSVRFPSDSVAYIKSVTSDLYTEDVKDVDISEVECHDDVNSVAGTRIVNEETAMQVCKETKDGFSRSKIRELELRVEMLEGELIEAAAIEIGLYSITAEHGNSAHKLHAPARRLSRLYIHASKQWSGERRASAARSAISGLVLAVKACGNDVPRLTFWLSNSIVLRAIVSQRVGGSNQSIPTGPHPESNGAMTESKKKATPLKWESSISKRQNNFTLSEEFINWEKPGTFVAALEKIEAWIFSRIIESMWWQTLAPHMLTANEGEITELSPYLKKKYGSSSSIGYQQHANFSIDIWKKAFKDACEKLCPVRAGGLECGCLPLLARLVMEQCIARLDVAMFNAILRQTVDKIPTDPISDPISDPKVLPIPPGKSSFGAGAQLKNAIGNWSRWLTDLFGIDDDDDFHEGENEQADEKNQFAATCKPFHLLNALSDLLMLPKDMLLDKSIRKEVCPTFSTSMIKQILDSFVPDEFCPDPIPDMVLEALDCEDTLETGEVIRNWPCNAIPIAYRPPSGATVLDIVGEVHIQSHLRSGSSVLRKSHASDDELDELDSPFTSIIIDKSPSPSPTANKCANVARYGLLHKIWSTER